jgi:signal transduction histidine kinase
MTPPFCRRRRRAWWPPDEPRPDWATARYNYRARFFRRAVVLATLVLLLGGWGAVSLVWFVVTRIGGVAPTPPAAAFVLGAGTIVAVAIVATALTGTMRRFVRPLGAVMDAADRVAGGDYDVRVAEHGPPPLRALARAFNTMTERLQSDDRLRRDLMADVAHELRTPLAVMQGKLEGVLDGVYTPDAVQIQQLLEETHVLSRLVEDLRTLALSESGALKLHKQPIDVAELARDAAESFGVDAAVRGVRLDVNAGDDLAPLDADPVRIREVITNLLSNALRHTPAGGSVVITVTPDSNDALVVSVRDSGPGMAADEIAHAFDRFYKGSESRGSGLGLTIAKNLVAAHGGTIHARSEIGQGTTVTFALPRERARNYE